MHAETVELLSGKGKFPMEQAVVMSAAIDMGIEKPQLVTVPIMDARFAVMDARLVALDARITQVEARMELKLQQWAVKMIIAMLMGQTALGPIGMEVFSSVRHALSTLVR